MVQQLVNLGTGVNTSGSDNHFEANTKHNANTTELYTSVAGKAATSHTHGVTDLTATGTASATTYLRGDNTWNTPAGGGGGEDVTGYDVATSYLMRGTVNAALYSGVTKGTGLSSAARIANLTNLQAALNYAATNRKFFELEPGDYEIEGTAGLVIPQTKNTGFVWKGTKGSHIKQFSNNCPVITIGDVGTGSLTEQIVVDGFRASYNTTQAANTASKGVRVGAMRNSLICNLNVFADYPALGFTAANGVKAYQGIVLEHGADPLSFFSNTMRDIHIGGCQMNFMSFGWDSTGDNSAIKGGGGTGNIFSNFYMSQGVTNNQQDIAGYPLRIRGQGDLYESVFEQINIEWCRTTHLIFAEIARNATFNSIHLEGNQLTGADSSIFNMSGSQINFSGINVLDLTLLAASATGTPSVFRTYGDCAVGGTGLAFDWSSGSRIDRDLQLVNVTSFTPPEASNAINITNIVTRDASVTGQDKRLALASTMPTSAFSSPRKLDTFRWDEALPDAKGASVRLNVDTTVYGCYSNPVYIYPAQLGAARVLVLATTMKASGTLSTVAVPTGAIVGVKRASDAAAVDAFNLTVHNATSGGTLLSTISTETTVWYRFNGTAWSVVT